jgi:hypothetical protein
MRRHGIPISLCVCRLTRQRGLRRQYATARCVLRTLCGPSIGCRKKMLEAKLLKRLRFGFRLRVNKFEFVARGLDELRACLRTDADPINTWVSYHGFRSFLRRS